MPALVIAMMLAGVAVEPSVGALAGRWEGRRDEGGRLRMLLVLDEDQTFQLLTFRSDGRRILTKGTFRIERRTLVLTRTRSAKAFARIRIARHGLWLGKTRFDPAPPMGDGPPNPDSEPFFMLDN